ncbi:penicillin-binding protein [Larkinella terrae]|uniref:PASTA domain-containing protein n=1 Tax=Larkinella terrae TaxID=2025311 RepID=A0A7K0EQB8_9BACT|nr:penicillin-binding transpeptidase domain-containing protein [Larkinella terrae]MRS63676.1 PASTA domain-containing protein [Larkinella terrae]
MNVKKAILRRATIASVAICVFAIAIIGQLVKVQFFRSHDGTMWKDRITQSHIRRDTLRATRGNICSSNGSFLATSLPYYYVGIDPRVAKTDSFNKKIDSLGLLLAQKFGDRSRDEYTYMIRKARENERQYLLLSRKRITYQERMEMQKWPFFRRDRSKSGLGGGKFDAVYQRYHPYGRMALRTVGYLNPETAKGFVGLESSFQNELAGKDGVGLVESLSGGVRMPIEDGSDIKPEPGLDIYTTIDVNFQDMAETALLHGLEKYQAEQGCLVVMEVETGEIRAMANLTLRNGKYVENFNHALAGGTDPGSTFKLPTMVALLEEKMIRPEQMVHTGGGVVTYHGRRISDAKRGGHGSITAQQVFEKSSNVGVHMLMSSFYNRPDTYCRYMRRFKLDKPIGLRLNGETKPVVPNPQSPGWSKLSLNSMAIGYELKLTPLQMLTFYNAIANDGKWVQPMLVKQVRRANEVVKDYEPFVSQEPLCSQKTIRIVKNMLEGVVERGTAKKSQSPYYRFAGKTGTAQKLINGRYQVGKYYTSFIGYFPAEKPKYSICVVVDSPRGANIDLLYGGSVSAPVFREIADRIYAYDVRMHRPVAIVSKPVQQSGKGVKAGFADDIRTISKELNMDTQPNAEGWVTPETQGAKTQWVSQTAREKVPDLRGMTLRDALHLLENRGFRVRFEGYGKVIDQSVPPGDPLPSPRKITLTLRQSARPDTLVVALNKKNQSGR